MLNAVSEEKTSYYNHRVPIPPVVEKKINERVKAIEAQWSEADKQAKAPLSKYSSSICNGIVSGICNSSVVVMNDYTRMRVSP